MAHYRKAWREIEFVLLDMVMLKLGGRDTFLAMRAINPSIRALLVSGYSLDGEAQSILDAGVLGFLQKPFTKADLAQAIAAALAAAPRP